MRTAVVTGARGIGYEVGRGLARSGMRVVFGVRTWETGERAAEQIRAELPGADVSAEVLDLADLKSAASFGERLAGSHDRIDVLVNNAGVILPVQREVTADGFELHFGTNHLGHFAMTAGVLPLLRAAEAPRVVVVGSLAHRRGKIDFDDLHAERSYKRVQAYAQSKLANLLFMTELQRRSEASRWGITAVGAHPGFAKTEAIRRPGDGRIKEAYYSFTGRFIPSAEDAARPIIFAATSPQVTPAGYYGPTGLGEIRGPVGPAKLAPTARDPELAARVWELSETLTGARF